MANKYNVINKHFTGTSLIEVIKNNESTIISEIRNEINNFLSKKYIKIEEIDVNSDVKITIKRSSILQFFIEDKAVNQFELTVYYLTNELKHTSVDIYDVYGYENYFSDEHIKSDEIVIIDTSLAVDKN